MSVSPSSWSEATSSPGTTRIAVTATTASPTSQNLCRAIRHLRDGVDSGRAFLRLFARPVQADWTIRGDARCEELDRRPGRMTTGTILRSEERPMRSSAVGWDVDRGMTGTDQEATLLARIARRDATAFETLYDRYSRAVYSLALRMLGNPQAAQEVAQEIFLHIWRGAGEFIPARGTARSWVLSLAHHRSVRALRRQRVPTVEPLAAGDRSAGGSADVVEQALRGVEGATVRSALMTLSAEQREAIVLAYSGGYTSPETPNRLKIPLGTVKTRIR